MPHVQVGGDKCMYVKSLSTDGAAKISNQVFLEDCLVSVDGRNVVGKPVTQVYTLNPQP